MMNLRQFGSWAIERASAPAALRMRGPANLVSAHLASVLRKAKEPPILCERTWSCGGSAGMQWRQAITGDGRVVLGDAHRPDGMLSAVLRSDGARSDDVFSAHDLRRRYAQAEPMGVVLSAADRDRLAALAWEAREGVFAETDRAFRAERATLSCFVPSGNPRTFERVLISEEGETDRLNIHPAAEALDEWLSVLLPWPQATLH